MIPQCIYDSILCFILMLYGDPSYPRKLVQDVVEYLDHFIRDVYLPVLKNDISALLKSKGISDHDVEQCFAKYECVFDNFKTEHKRFECFKQQGIVSYEEFLIGKTFVPQTVDNKIRLIEKEKYAIHVPLRKTLKNFLELPGLFHNTLNYIKSLKGESNIISNIMQAKLWLNKYAPNFGEAIFLPIYLFYDDLEVGNALGSHSGSQKFGALYASIACLPPCIASKLSSIFLTLLVNTNDKKGVDSYSLFRKVIEEMNFLQKEGIIIKINKTLYNVKFQLVLILGDNLGLNGLFGFV